MPGCSLKLLTSTALSTIVGLSPLLVWAGPEGARVNSGNVAVRASQGETVITQHSARGDISWDSFDIGRDERVRFNHPSANSVTLNRIGGQRPSQIQGQLSANGQVWLQNPSGILFGRGAQVDVGGLLATTSQISKRDFAAGVDRFASPGGAIVNEGTIRAGQGGVAFVAPVVENTGDVMALGPISAHAGSAFRIDQAGDGLLSVIVEYEAPLAVALNNSGRISSTGGSVYLSAADAETVANSLITLNGIVEAAGIRDQDGKISIVGSGEVDIKGSLSAYRGADGGDITIVSDQVVLRAGGEVDVSGDAGGRINFGPGTSPIPVRRIGVERGAILRADATGNGDAGDIIFRSTEITDFRGHASATASGSGDGGFIDISSIGSIQFDGSVDLISDSGENGTLLFDPRVIRILDDPDDLGDGAPLEGDVDFDGDFFITELDGRIDFEDLIEGDEFLDDEFSLSKGRLEAVQGDVILQATEIISVETDLSFSNQDLTLESQDYIVVRGAVVVEDGSVTLRASEVVQIGEPVDELGELDLETPTGSLRVTDGNITIETGEVNGVEGEAPFISLLGDVVAIGTDGDGRLTATSAGDFFIEATKDIRGQRVELTAESALVQAPIVEATSTLITITSEGTGDDGGVNILADSVLLAGRVVSESDITITATGEDGGAVTIGDFTTLDAFLGGADRFQLEGIESLVIIGTDEDPADGPGLFAPGQIVIDAVELITIDNPVGSDPESIGDPAAQLDLTSADFSINTGVFAEEANFAFTGSGTVGLSLPPIAGGGGIDGGEVERISATTRSFLARDDLRVGSIDLDAPVGVGTEFIFSAVETVEVTGILNGDAGEDTQFSVAFGQEDGVRPQFVTITSDGSITGSARIGVDDDAPSPIDDLSFFVNGDVLIDPPGEGSEIILAATGTTTIDITGSFLQLNTAAPGLTENPEANPQLADGVGGAGAILGPVVIENAAALELFGILDERSESQAVFSVSFGGDFEPSELHQVNDCFLTLTNCSNLSFQEPTRSSPEPTRSSPEPTRSFQESTQSFHESIRIGDPVFPELALPTVLLGAEGALPDFELILGTFFRLEADLAPEREPITNRGNDEEWQR